MDIPNDMLSNFSAFADFKIRVAQILTDSGINATADESLESLAYKVSVLAAKEIDQTYNPESENAQSGIAVAEAITKISYTNTEALINDIGGIKASEHTNGFNNVLITDLITELLYPYTQPIINAFTLNPGAGVKEKGISITLNSASTKITKKSKSISKVDLYKGSTLLASKTQADDNINITSSGTTITFSDLNDILDGNTNTTYYIKISEENGTTDVVSKSATYTFVNPYYHGVINSGTTITEDLITGLTKDISSKNSKNYSYTTTSTQCAVIAYPSSYGVLNGIKDANGFNQTWEQHTVTIKGVNYYVYISGAAEATNFKYTFTY